MLEGYLDRPEVVAAPREVLVKLEPGAWVAAGVALALLAQLNAAGAGLAIEVSDPAARALCGAFPERFKHAARGRAWLSTREPTRRHGKVLAVLPSLEEPVAPAVDGSVRGAVVGWRRHGPAPLPHGWLAALSPHEALRIALGDRSGAALRLAAGEVGAWLALPLVGIRPSLVLP